METKMEATIIGYIGFRGIGVQALRVEDKGFGCRV